MRIYTYFIVHEVAEILKRSGFSCESQFNWTTYRVNRIHFLENGNPHDVVRQIEELTFASHAIGGEPILLMHASIFKNPQWYSALRSIRSHLGLKCFSDMDMNDILRELTEPDISIRAQWSHLKCGRGNNLFKTQFNREFLISYSRSLTCFATDHRHILGTAKRAFEADEFFFFRIGGVWRYALKALPVCGFEMQDEVPTPFGLFNQNDRVRLGKKESVLTENTAFWRPWLQMVRNGGYQWVFQIFIWKSLLPEPVMVLVFFCHNFPGLISS